MTDARISILFRTLSVTLAAQLRDKDPVLADWFAHRSHECNTDDWQQNVTKAREILIGVRTADNPIVPPRA